MKNVTLDEDRPFSAIYGNIGGKFSAAKYEQDGCFFDSRKNLIAGQDYQGPTPPAKVEGLDRTAAKTTVGKNAVHEVTGVEVKGLKELDAWMSSLSGSKGYQELIRYTKDVLRTSFDKTNFEEMKVLVRAVFIARSTWSLHNKKPAPKTIGKSNEKTNEDSSADRKLVA